MRLAISHDTTYCYEDRVRASIQYLRLTPQQSARQHIHQWDLDLPAPAQPQRDPFGNILHVLTLEEPHEAIHIRARGLVEIDEQSETEPVSGSPLPYLRCTPLTAADDALRDFAHHHCGERRSRDALGTLMAALGDHIVYTPGATQVDSTAATAFAGRVGVCQDHAHAFLACVRSLALPARYVSGYLCTADSDHLASHAWVEVWLDGAWYSFDVTNQLTRPERHLKLAVGLDYLDACPVRGIRRGGGMETMHALVRVAPREQHQQ